MALTSYTVDVLRLARADIEANFDYMEEAYGMNAALDYTIALTDAIDTLGDNPQRCPRFEPDLSELRRLIYRNHAVYFRLEGRDVLVLRVLHTSRDHEAELQPSR